MGHTAKTNRSTRHHRVGASAERRLFVLACLGCAIVCSSGCGLGDFSFEVPEEGLFDSLARPELANVPPRLALGTTARVEIRFYDGEETVSSSDSSVVATERRNSRDVVLTAVGVGVATITLTEAGTERKRYSVRVSQVERSEVLLVEEARFFPNLVEVVPAHGQMLLGGVEQRLVLAHYDSDGAVLYGRGLASFDAVEGAESCDVGVAGPFDAACVVLRVGTNVVRAESDAGETEIVMIGVAEDHIVDLIVVETNGLPTDGDLVGMIALGITEDDGWVYGIHASYQLESTEVLVPTFAYDFDANAELETVLVTGAGFERELEYQGVFNLISHPKSLWAGCGGFLLESC